MNIIQTLQNYKCQPGHHSDTWMLCLQPKCNEKQRILCDDLCVNYYHKNHKIIPLQRVTEFFKEYIQNQQPILHETILSNIEEIRTLQKEINLLIDQIVFKVEQHFGRFSLKASKIAAELQQECTVERVEDLAADLCEIASINDQIIKIKVIRPLEPLPVINDLKVCVQKLAGFSIGKMDAQTTKPEDLVNFYQSHQRTLTADGEVWCLETAKNGLLASAGVDRKVTFWNMDNLGKLWSTKKHSSPITSLCFSTDFTTLVSGSVDGDIKIWNMETKSLIKKLLAHQSNVSSIAYSNNNKQIFTAGWDCKIKCWTINEKSIDPIEFMGGHTDKIYSIALSPDNTFLASSSLDKTIRLWDSNALCQIGDPICGHKERVDMVCFTLNQKYLASCSSVENNIIIWNLNNREIFWNFKPEHSPHKIVFSQDGNLIISVHKDVRVFDITTQIFIGKPIKGHQYYALALKQSRDGRYLITGFIYYFCLFMKQHEVFSKRQTQRPVNNLTCVDSQQTSALFILKMKEITQVYKQEGYILKESMNIFKEQLQTENESIFSEINPQIQQLKSDLKEFYEEYEQFNKSQELELREIRTDNLEVEQSLIELERRQTEVFQRLGDQVLQRKYDIKL